MSCNLHIFNITCLPEDRLVEGRSEEEARWKQLLGEAFVEARERAVALSQQLPDLQELGLEIGNILELKLNQVTDAAEYAAIELKINLFEILIFSMDGKLSF